MFKNPFIKNPAYKSINNTAVSDKYKIESFESNAGEETTAPLTEKPKTKSKLSLFTNWFN